MSDNCGNCGHVKRSHKYEDGFYDVRGHYADCTVVGCPCHRYRWNGEAT